MVSSWSFEVPTLLRQSLGDGEAQAMLPGAWRPPASFRGGPVRSCKREAAVQHVRLVVLSGKVSKEYKELNR